MSRSKAKDMRSLSLEELEHKRQGLEKELFGLRQKQVTGQLDKPHQFKAVRRQVAQVLTIQKEKKQHGK